MRLTVISPSAITSNDDLYFTHTDPPHIYLIQVIRRRLLKFLIVSLSGKKSYFEFRNFSDCLNGQKDMFACEYNGTAFLIFLMTTLNI